MVTEESPRWTKSAILERLAATGGPQAGLQVFLDKGVAASDLEAAAREIVAEAAGDEEVRIGAISRLGRSFAVHGSLATLRRISDDPRVTSILPASVGDVLPKPRTEGS